MLHQRRLGKLDFETLILSSDLFVILNDERAAVVCFGEGVNFEVAVIGNWRG